MKKSNFTALVLGTVGGILSAIGMCMALLPEWNAFIPGVVVCSIGIVVLLIMLLVWRKMENKVPIRLTAKTILTVAIGIVGALMLGVGMCLVMVWSQMIFGIITGVAGIILLILLIPLIKGIK